MNYHETILVTGGAGFIGSAYLNRFVREYPDTLFINVDALTYAGTLENLTVSELPNYRFYKVDIRDLEALTAIFKAHRPTGVVHFAAESHVDLSIEHPSLFVETNIIGTHNLLALAREHGVKRFHHISTDEVYGALERDGVPFTTNSPLAPNSPYSASKTASDLLVRSYNRTYGLDTVISRSSNNFGPRQDLSKLVPKFITNLLKGEKVPLYADGSHVRDWLFVDDHVEAIDHIFRTGEGGAVYNIGGGVELSNKELTHKLLALTGRDASFIEHVQDRPGHDFRYAIDASELMNALGWSASRSFEEALAETIAYYRELLG